MPTKFREPTKINMKEEAKGPVVKKSSASAAVKKPEPAAATATAPSSTKRDMPELLSEQADLLFLELIKERLQNGREVQYALQQEVEDNSKELAEENGKLKNENKELKDRIAVLEKELNSVKEQVMSTLSALGSVDLNGE